MGGSKAARNDQPLRRILRRLLHHRMFVVAFRWVF